MRYILFTIAILVLSACPQTYAQQGGSQSSGDGKCPDEVAYTGKYENPFGFSVVIPDGLHAFWISGSCVRDSGSCVCMGDHGRSVPLNKNASIELFAGYNVLDHERPGEATDDWLEWLKKRVRPNSFIIQSRVQTYLDSLSAERIVVRYPDPRSDLVMVEDRTVALRNVIYEKTGGISSREYTVSLLTPEADYSLHGLVLERVLKSWRATIPRN